MPNARLDPSQFRAARALLGWSIADLSAASGVSIRAIKYVEDETSPKQPRSDTLSKLSSALETAGIEFIGTPDDGPGVRLCRRP